MDHRKIPERVGHRKDPAQLGHHKGPARAGRRKDPTRAGQRKDPARAGQRKDPTRVGQRKDPARVGHHRDPDIMGTRSQCTMGTGRTGADPGTASRHSTKTSPTSRPHRLRTLRLPPANPTETLLTCWAQLSPRTRAIYKITRKLCICISRMRGPLEGAQPYQATATHFMLGVCC